MKIFNTFGQLAAAKVLTGTPVRVLEPALIDGVVEATGEGLSLLSGNVFVPSFGDQESITARKTSLLDDAFTGGISAYINTYKKDNSGNWLASAGGRTSAVFYAGQVWWPLVEIPYTPGGYLITGWSLPTGNPDILEVTTSIGTVFQFNRFMGLIDGGSSGGSTVSNTPPINPLAGNRWTRCSDMKSFIWYVDNDGAQWVEDNPSMGGYTKPAAYYGTVAQIAAGQFSVGDRVTVIDRANGVFEIVRGGTANGFDKIDAGNGNTSTLQFGNEIILGEIGVVGNGIVDDTAALQRALELSFLQQKDLKGANITCRTTSTLYIGNYGDATKYTSIDFGGLVFKPDDSVNIVIDSGKIVGGTWVTSWLDPIETYMSFFTTFGNFKILGSSDSAKDGRTAVRLKDWHYQCELKHIGMVNFETGMSIKHVFGIEINQCSIFNTNPNNRTGQGFLLYDNVNLVKLHRCLATNTGVGYYLKGGISGVSIDNCSLEGQTKGLVCEDAVYALEVSNCYLENITDVCFTFLSQVYSANINNNYINLSTIASSSAYVVDYLELPNNNIQFDSNNHIIGTGGSPLSGTRFVKNINLHTTFGYNRFSLYKKTSSINSLNDLLVDNNHFPKGMNIDHTLDGIGLKTDVVNNFAKGTYSGRYTDGYSRQNGFIWNNLNNSTLQVDTKIVESDTGRIYVNFRVSAGGLSFIAGEFVKYGGTWKFYKFDSTGLVLSTDLSLVNEGGFMRISGTYSNTVTNVLGEVRLI